MRVLITGLCGFIGHHVAEHLLANTDWELVGLDRIDATSTPHRLRHIPDWESLGKRVKFVWHDLRAPINETVDKQIGHVDVLIHMAASTHVDRSISDPLLFVQDNVVGTAHLLDWWRRRGLVGGTTGYGRFMVHFSTDEVFGPAEGDYFFKEWDRYKSASPYSATKAGAEELCCAFSNTYKLKIAIIRVMNVIGERQHPEKFVPMTLGKLLKGEEILIHANQDCSAVGTRYYLHAANVAKALHWLVNRRESFPLFDKWNLSGEREVSNLEMAQLLAQYADKPLRYRLVDSDQLRPGHDLRYAIDGTKLREAGFSYPMNFEQSLERIAKWTLAHPEWLH